MIRGIIAGALGFLMVATIFYFAFSEIHFSTAFMLAGVGLMFGFALGTLVTTVHIRQGSSMALRYQESTDNTQVAQQKSLEYIIKTVVGSTLSAQFELFKQAQRNMGQQPNQNTAPKFPPLIPTTTGKVIEGNVSAEQPPAGQLPNSDEADSGQVFDASDFQMTGFDNS